MYKKYLILFVFSFILFKINPLRSQAQADSLNLAKKWYKKAVDADREGDRAKCNEALQVALRLASAAKDDQLTGRALNFLAINRSDEGKRDEGISLSMKAFGHLMQAGDTVRASNVKINIGMDYAVLGNYEEALKHELEGLALRLKCGDSTNLATFYQHIGEVYKELSVIDKWKSSLETANLLAQNPKYASIYTRVGILNDYGGVFETEKRYNEAVKVYQEMYGLSKKENYTNGMATSLSNLSPVYAMLGNPQKALECAQEALSIHKSEQNNYGCMCCYQRIGEACLDLGKLNLAEENFRRGLTMVGKNEYLVEKKTLLEGLYKVARHQQHWKEALEFLEQSTSISDSLKNSDIQAKLTELETRFQTTQKEQQIERLRNENELKNARIKTQKTILWAVAIIILLVGGMVFVLFKRHREKFQARQNELEQKLLRSQMNPHFIFNSLAAIQSYMVKNDGRQAAIYLSSFSSLMRSILKNSREEWVTLEEEKKTLENYLNLHQLRLGKNFRYALRIAEEIDPESVWVPPMLIQPFVENSIMHGIEIEENGFIEVTFAKESNLLNIKIEDNGKGLGNTKPDRKHTSYALQIFRERVANLKKTSGLRVEHFIGPRNLLPNPERGTLVIVKIPIFNP